jgi:hypothetical protein
MAYYATPPVNSNREFPLPEKLSVRQRNELRARSNSVERMRRSKSSRSRYRRSRRDRSPSSGRSDYSSYDSSDSSSLDWVTTDEMNAKSDCGDSNHGVCEKEERSTSELRQTIIAPRASDSRRSDGVQFVIPRNNGEGDTDDLTSQRVALLQSFYDSVNAVLQKTHYQNKTTCTGKPKKIKPEVQITSITKLRDNLMESLRDLDETIERNRVLREYEERVRRRWEEEQYQRSRSHYRYRHR